ncbi:Fc.00g089330.m01.CDS01 [Cosmosporella sp. VM-42]
MAPKPVTLSMPQQREPPPWPHSHHFCTATILAIAIVVFTIALLLRLLTQLLRNHHARRNGFVLTTGSNRRSYSYTTINHNTNPIFRPKTRRPRPTSYAELEARQLLFPPTDTALLGERLPLYNPQTTRGSLYNTFQIPPPHTTRLKGSRSMMEFNSGNPLDVGPKDLKKSKTIHWHGVNRLNTAWGWMS